MILAALLRMARPKEGATLNSGRATAVIPSASPGATPGPGSRDRPGPATSAVPKAASLLQGAFKRIRRAGYGGDDTVDMKATGWRCLKNERAGGKWPTCLRNDR